jgi:protein TonB
MKFVSLKSRGGNYLVVAQNIAWLRTHEDGQTKVGIVGGDYLLVAGTIEETAAAILSG